MTATAPPAPAIRPRLRAEHVVLAVVATLAVIGFAALVPDALPRGTPVGTTCAWHGSRLVVSGAVVNTGMASAQFRIDARVWIAGRPHPLRRSAFTDLAPIATGRWAAPAYGDARKGLVGNRVERCVAHVHTIPPPTGED